MKSKKNEKITLKEVYMPIYAIILFSDYNMNHIIFGNHFLKVNS